MRNIDWKKQLIDQSAHFLIGAMAVFCFIWGVQIHWAIAVGLVGLAAFVRELTQHPEADFGWGTALDMAFWLAGAMTAALLWRW